MSVQIGVLLPVRIETVFDQPNGEGTPYRLRVLVIPDDASINRHDPEVSEQELVSVEELWRLSAGDLSTETGRLAFQRLAARHNPARLLWLARTFPPQRDAQGQLIKDAEGHVIDWKAAQARLRDRAKMDSIAGFPRAIALYMVRSGHEPELLARSNIDPIQLQIDFNAEKGWWSSWEAAEAVGLGLEIKPDELNMTTEDELRQIEALFVVGVDEHKPADLFADHCDAGVMGFITPGTPTNTIIGQPAADLGKDPETWRRLWNQQPGYGSTRDLSLALTGDPRSLGSLPGNDDHQTLNQILVRSLWYPLWGHALKDIWGLGDSVFDVGVWADDYLFPEGPLPTLRIGDQPYGVLPTTSLSRWHPKDENEPATKIETAMLPWLLRQRDYWLERAENTGTVVGANTEKWLDLLRHTPTSSGYARRLFWPLEIAFVLSRSVGMGNPSAFAEYREEWHRLIEPIAQDLFPIQPARRYQTPGHPHPLPIPLVQPQGEGKDPEYFHNWLRLFLELGFDDGGGAWKLVDALEFRDRFPDQVYPPDSLFLRLWAYAIAVSDAEWKRVEQGVSGAMLEPLFNSKRSLLKNWVMAEPHLNFDEIVNAGNGPPQLILFQRAIDSAIQLEAFTVEEIERVFRATLDTAMHRIDPWITGIAWRRLMKMQEEGASSGLGIYGWVDQPFFGRRGPTDGGLLHAPSHAQALAAVILRDKAINDPEPERWQMILDSTSVRLAKQFADEVRAGSHIQDVLGRAVERAVGDPVLTNALRRKFPIRREHAAKERPERRVCDGQAVLDTFVKTPNALGLPNEILEKFAPLSRIVDVYADMLVAEAAFDVVSGRPEAAGAAMEAAAGLGLPPTLDLLRTPRRGRQATTSVFLALPDDTTPPANLDSGVSPGEVADSALAAFLAQESQKDGQPWQWIIVNGQQQQTVTLAQLGLSPVDTLALSAKTLDQLAVVHVQGEQVDDENAATTARSKHEQTKRLAEMLAGQPVQRQDLQLTQAADKNDPLRLDLQARYERLEEAAGNLAASLAAATEAEQLAALQAAVRWGIAPVAEEDETLAELADRVKALLDDRLTRVKAALASNQGVEDAPSGQLAEAISQLATGGALPIFGRLTLAELNASLAPDESLQLDQGLNENWLEIMAAIRPTLGRIESLQLERQLHGQAPIPAWSNHPGDPWQKNAIAQRDAYGFPKPSRLNVIYNLADDLENAPPDRHLAVAVLDGWGETIPDDSYMTSAAFGFNAPAARAPQAILIAVPPDETQALDTETLVQILLETRQLVHARMASPAELTDLSGVLPLTMLPTYPQAGVNLEPGKEL